MFRLVIFLYVNFVLIVDHILMLGYMTVVKILAC